MDRPDRSATAYDAAATFVLRTPALPWSALEAWRADAADASEPSVQALRERLRVLVARPEVDEAIRIASPGLHASLATWREAPTTPYGQRIEIALVRYVVRMATRPTPFGLLAGVGTGELGARTTLRVPPVEVQRRHSRLDNDILFALAEALAQDPEHRRFLRFRPNSSLETSGDRLRYAEAHGASGDRRYRAVWVRRTQVLTQTLARCRHGARLDALAAAIVADHPSLGDDQARRYVDELARKQLLVPELGVAVTGGDPIADFVAQLERAELGDSAIARLVRDIRDALAAEDRRGVATVSAFTDEVARLVAALPVAADPSRLVQVDLVRPPCGMTLGRNVVVEIQRAVETLRRMTPARVGPLQSFLPAFAERYGEREVPLAEALDVGTGIGFGAVGPGPAASALLAGLPFPAPTAAPTAPWGAREQYLQRLLLAAAADGRHEIVLTEHDCRALEAPDPTRLPEAWSAMVRVAAVSSEAIDGGEFSILLDCADGPSGARLLGRFCHISPEVDGLVRANLRAEEAARGDAIFAEVVHLPEGRVGNVVCRPRLREHEIAYLGLGAAAEEASIPWTDLMVSVRGGRVVLRSRRLDREIVPRLTSAHVPGARGLPVYRFLIAVQAQDGSGLFWSWGPLEVAPFLPRVRIGRSVVARARWLLDERELAPLAAAARSGDAARTSRAVQALRTARKLPAICAVADGDYDLPLDLDNPLCASAFASMLAGRTTATVFEAYPGPDELCAVGPGGRYAHEALVCFGARAAGAAARRPDGARLAPAASPVGEAVERRLAPGTSCLYAKVYGGVAGADAVLREIVAPVVRDAVATGAASHWFFLRYADPAPHLRIRCFGEPATLVGAVLPALQRALAPLLRDDVVSRLQLDTYEREIERYGGPAAIELAERLFWHDSEAALDVLDAIRGDDGSELRWQLALRGADAIVRGLGLDEMARGTLYTRARDGLAEELGVGTAFHRELGARFRARQAQIERVLSVRGDEVADDRGLASGLAALARCAAGSAELFAAIRAMAAAGTLAVELEELAASLVHMHVNRLFPELQRQQELVLYDFLRRAHLSRVKRGLRA